MGDTIEFTTTPNHRNIFYKISSSGISFEVKTARNAAIGLAREPGKKCDLWVVIGCDDDTWIKGEHDRGKSIVTPNILSSEEYKRFWISWKNERIQLGQGYDQTPIISHVNYLDLNYVTFSTDSHGYYRNEHDRHITHWKLELPPTLKPIQNKLISCGEMQWVPADNQLPDGALIGGFENESLYIIRAPHLHSLTPGDFVPSYGTGYIAWGRESHEKNSFEVLCGFDCKWVPTFSSRIPVNAVEGGYSEGRETLYVGRALVDGHLIPGKVQPSHRVCYVPYEGKEIARERYEILVSSTINSKCCNKLFIDNISIDRIPEPEYRHHDDYESDRSEDY